MKYSFQGNGAFKMATIQLAAGENIKIERGAMVYHDGGIVLEGKMNSNGSSGLGGILKAAARSAFGGESFFITTASGVGRGGNITIAPAAIGDICEINVGAQQWRINDGCFLACDQSVSYDMKRQSLSKAFLGGTGGLFVMETSGMGTMLVAAFGELIELSVEDGGPLTIDNTHVVAWHSGLQYEIKVASGTFGFKTGEGLVNEFRGNGKVLVQTRNARSLAEMIVPYIPKQSS